MEETRTQEAHADHGHAKLNSALRAITILENTRRLLSLPVPAGTNRVVLADAPNLADLMGYFVKPEGTVVVFSQNGPDGYAYVASIPPTLWDELLGR